MEHKMIGDVFWADLSPTVGEELGGIRKVVIIKDSGDVVTVVPTTMLDYVGIRLPDWSFPVVSQVKTISKERLREYDYHLNDVDFGELQNALREHLFM